MIHGLHLRPEAHAGTNQPTGPPHWRLAHPKRARWHLHFAPTSSSWLNLVESWFGQLTNRRLNKGAFSSIAQLNDAIGIWTEHWNKDPQLLIWSKPADEIIAKLKRERAILASVKSATDH